MRAIRPQSGYTPPILYIASLSIVPLLQLTLSPAGTPILPSWKHAAWADFVVLGFGPLAFFSVCAAAWAVADALVVAGLAPSLAAMRCQPIAPLPSSVGYLRALQSAAVSWVLVGLPWAWLLASTIGPRLHMISSGTRWNAWELVSHVPVYLLAVEVGFYASHRLLHVWRLPYDLIHRKHHEFSAPFALAAVHAHPLEHLVSNVLPISLGPLLARSHPMSALVWACFSIFSTCGAHSGYAVPGLTRAPFHDWHHEILTENFGVLGPIIGLDRWLGTSTRFRAKLLDAGHSRVDKHSKVDKTT